ncbi:MAG: filamentous hemagglutinin N-terminal domain-containing protein, partial [Gallionella sp.]|nr:filamentous hemagglutinin N-terminal domain-containing protein [Gallionella sp.]
MSRKIVRLKHKRFHTKQICISLVLALATNNAHANPIGAAVVNGQASFATKGNTLTVTNTPGTIINWQGFSIGANEITRFAQQSASSAVLNRVIANNPSNILGSLQSNGRVFLVNPSGIVFGANATVNVAGMVASTLNISNADFLAGRNNFTSVPGAQNISNAGNLTAQNGGQIYLIAPNVENTGIVNAPSGEILLAAGHSVELVNSNDPNLRVNITAPAGSATNVGQLVASSGSLGLFGAVVKNSGTVNANSATLQGGKIVFKASQRAEVSGTVTANGTTGGTIQALGNQVGIMDGATVTANGTQGGGTVLIGGDYQGKNPNVQNAQVTYVAPTASISADATQNGNGGKLIVWSDSTTRAYGNLSAKGGVNGGNGGFIETSGHYLDVAGIRIDATALNGNAGNWLLDPINVTITATADAGGALAGTAPSIWTPTLTGSTITNATINAALNAGTSVTITTTGGLAEAGNITVSAAIAKTAGAAATLTLQADGSIAINQPITSTVGALNLLLNYGTAGSATVASTLGLLGGTLDVQKAGVVGSGTLNSNNATLNGVTIGSNLTMNGNYSITNGITLANGVTVSQGGTYNQWSFNSPGVNHIATTGTATLNSNWGVFYIGL